MAVALLNGDADAAAAKARDMARWDPPTDDIDPDDRPSDVWSRLT